MTEKTASARRPTLQELGRLIVQRRWLILIPFAVGVGLTPLLARYAPARYRSEALIVVVPQQVPDDYVKPTVSQSVEQRLPSITDQILSRSKLELIIKEMNLYKAEQARSVMEDVVERMRLDVTTSPAGKTVDSFRVGYVSDNAETARKVTERLAGLYIDQNSMDREAQADHTSEFLETQLANAKRRLGEEEKRLEEYRKRHAGEMPSQMSGNLQAIQNANLQLQSLNESANRAQERRLFIERQIADAEAVPDPATVPPALPSPPVAGSAPAPLSTAQELQQAQARRAALLQRFTPNLPEVVTLDRTIAELAERLAAEAPLSTQAATRETPAEAAQLKRIRDWKAELAVLDLQMGVNRTEVARLQKTIAEYQAKVDAVPTRESELVELTRDYSTMQAAYTNLRMKSEDSVIAANLERRKIGEQFKLVDPASRPERPFNQRQRLAVKVSGAIVGLVLGLLVVGLLEYRDSSFRRGEEVLEALSLPVLASIPVMRSDREKQAATRRRRVLDVGGTAVLVAAGVVLALWRP